MSYDPLNDDIGLGDEDKDRVNTGKVDWYKGEKGRTDRVAFVYFHTYELNALKKALRANPKLDDAGKKKVVEEVRSGLATKLGKAADQLTQIDLLDTGEVKFKVNDVHYKEGQGFGYILSRLGKDGEAADEVWRKLPAAKTTVTTALVIYPTTRDGDLEKERLARDTKVVPWKFSGDKWDKIRHINKGLQESGHTIGEYDLLFACKDTQYQKIEITQSGPALWRRNPDFARLVLTKALAVYDKLMPARAMTTEELRDKLGMGGGAAAPGSDIADINFSNVLEGV
jgi:hypothetical protein